MQNDSLSFSHLPNDVLQTIINNQDLNSLIALHQTCKETSDIAGNALKNLKTRWEEWLTTSNGSASGVSSSHAVDINTKLIMFAFADSNKTLNFPDTQRAQRKYIHTRAAMMGLKTSSVHRRCKADTATVVVTRPVNWQLPEMPLNPTVMQPKVTRKIKMNEWSTCCEECGSKLNAHMALYHWSGLGPLCEACVDADEELCGLKWESKASFWF